MARLRSRRRLRTGDVGVGATWRGRPLLTLTRSAWCPLWNSCLRDVNTGLRWTLEDPVEARRHPLGVVAVVIAIAAIILTGDSSSGSPLCLDFALRVSSAWRSRLFSFSFFFCKSTVDFCFSADSHRLSRSTSSSFTGGLVDRTSIDPCATKGKL